MNQYKSISVNGAARILLARGNPFLVPPPELRKRDATRFVSPDARRAIVRRAAAASPDAVQSDLVLRDDMPMGLYSKRPSVELCIGAHLSQSARLEAARIWAWPGPQSLEEFYRRFPFLHPTSDIAEHFAERRFLTEVVIPVLGELGLQRLEAQVPFTDLNGGSRRADFVLHGEKDYALEVEGQVHDVTRMPTTDMASEKLRQRSLPAAGFEYQPFVYSQIADGQARHQFEQLCARDSTLAPMITSSPYANAESTQVDPALSLLTRTTVLLRQIYAVALALCAGSADEALVVAVDADDLGLVAMAFADVLSLVRAAAALEGAVAPVARVRLLYPADWRPEFSCLPDYFASESWTSDRRDKRLDALEDPDALRIEWGADLQRDAAQPLRADWPPSQLEHLAHPVLGRVPGQGPTAEPVVPPRWALDTVARWLFPDVAALRDEQFHVISDMMMGKSKMVVLPTAGGKSLCYQLPALIRDGVVLVVSPLRALIHDQLEGLRSCGIAVATSLTSADRGIDAKAAKLRRVERGEVQLLYVAPERLLIRSFVQEVAASSARWGLWAIAVDEAHCVSEWGHDFRPSYLHIAKFRRQVERHRAVVMLALTGTASSLVRKDVMNVLDITEVEQPKSSDREEISFSVHEVKKATRHAAMGEHLADELPAVLRRSGDDLYRHKSDPQGVVVFVPFANPHGATTHDLGVASVRRHLISSGQFSANEVRVHASQQVTLCPNPSCGSPSYSEASGKFTCRECKTVFSEPAPLQQGDWLEAVTETQNQFKASEFPVLVATKGYGMGIDKRNIRGIVHASFSSGLESYYQEVGRAARDGEHGHASLFFAPPADECVRDYLSQGAQASEPPCVSQAKYYKWWKCPFLPYVCDYGFQARFIKDSYPGEQADLTQVLALFDVLDKQDAAELKVSTHGDRDLNAKQLALYRLMCVGYVADYSIEYGDGGVLYVEKSQGWTADVAHETAAAHLQRLVLELDRSLVDPEIQARIAAVPGTSGRTIVAGLVSLLLEFTYRNVKGMRYQMLQNQYRYATNSEGRTCRRSYIRGTFDELARDEPCGFCDVCVSDRRFSRTRAHKPISDGTLSQLSRAIPEIVRQFDPVAVSDAVAVAERSGAIEGLQTRAEHLLESQPNNQALLLLAAEAAMQRGVHSSALAHLSDATAANDALTRDRTRAELYYGRAHRVSAHGALGLIDRSRGVFDDAEGHRFLVNAVTADAPQDHARLQRISAVVALDQFEELLAPDRIASLRSGLSEFTKEFAL